MRFSEISLSLIPPGMRSWVADEGDYHFVIAHEDGATLTPQDRAEWVGFTASWKSYEGRDGEPIRVDGRWGTLAEAAAACDAELLKLRSKR